MNVQLKGERARSRSRGVEAGPYVVLMIQLVARRQNEALRQPQI
jgi:hypothetical protein